MNTSDMYSREKVADARQAEIERHLRDTALLREEKRARFPAGRGWALAAGGALLTALLIALLVVALASASGF